jgi:heterodisulfide reductase subunit A-like polyferredoxin
MNEQFSPSVGVNRHESAVAQSGSRPVGAVLVVGAGIAGIQSSLDLANSGFKVYLVEAATAIGGIMAQLDKTFPTNDCAMCIMSPKLVECGRHINIELLTGTEVEAVDGGPGDFRVKVVQQSRFIDVAKCTGCGECEKACPVSVESQFDEGIVERKACYRLYAQAYPNAFAIEKKTRPPCQQSCPAGVHAQGYVALIRDRKFHEAYELVRQQNPFVSICGRVCHHPCEGECRRGEYDDPVAIMALKRFVADREYAEERELPEPEPTTHEETIGIVGAGPSGLTCAFRLREAGFGVTVYDEAAEPGGMLVSCLPEYRIPKAKAEQDIKRILSAGIDVKTGVRVGRDVTLADLRQRHNAVYVAVGFQQPARLFSEYDESVGVLTGLDFLRQVKTGAARGEGVKPTGFGERVAVIGGGNVAIDCAMSALRLGAREVKLLCLETRNLDSRDRMPAHSWEIEEAEQEGIDIRDRIGPKGLVVENGRVSGVSAVQCRSVYDEDGKFAPVFDESAEPSTVTADTVIVAVGQRSDLTGFEELKSGRGAIEADPVTLATSMAGVFAGGDIKRGPASVVEAVWDGNEAAESISRFLAGADLEAGREKEPDRQPAEEWPKFVARKERTRMPVLPVKERRRGFQEIDLGYSEDEAIEEAGRCLNCGVCSECLECVRVCEADAVIHTMKREQMELKVGAIVLAPGVDKFDAALKPEFGYGKYPNVLSSIQFERVLAASGPYQGHVQRPSDGKVPHRIAWLQCVGSRDTDVGSNYCSSVCCMYAMKEAVIAKEHVKGTEATIFFMDLRAYGKDFERYYERAEKKHGVSFVRARVGKVEPVGDEGNLRVQYVENGEMKAGEFDLVVLSAGFKPGTRTSALAETFDVELNQHGFFKTPDFAPTATTRPGVFVCGIAAAPKDIPETVMQASAAASSASSVLSDVRGTEVTAKTYPVERDVQGESPRVGVFVCHCGINIGSVVDVPGVVKFSEKLPGVVHAEDNLFTCSQDTQQKIKEVIDEYRLNRVVVASCSPRTHEPLFQETLREAGLNPNLFEMANIRDQCSWVHGHVPERATEKAKTLVQMAVAKARLLEPLRTVVLPVNQRAFVIGGGLAGMTAATAIAEEGFEVVLVEREAELGGNLRRIHYTIEGADVDDYRERLIGTVTHHPRIDVQVGTTVESIEGYLGNFRSKLRNGTGGTGTEVEHGVVLVTTGAVESVPGEYLYGQDESVVTLLQLEERLATGEPKLLGRLKNVVMIQCVGSRDDSHPYCSRVCCQGAVKNARRLKAGNPKANVYVLYRDMRTYGFMEEMFQQARAEGVIFIRYEPEHKPVVVREGDALNVKVHDLILDAELTIHADLVALAPAIVPRGDAEVLSRMLKVPLNEDRFFLEAHAKLRPVDFSTEGVFFAGLAHAPKLIPETIAQAKAAAARAATVLAKELYEASATTAKVNEDVCAGCGMCVAECTYGALELVERADRIVSHVNEALCKGCGNCAAICPSGAINHLGFKSGQTEAMINAALKAIPS